MSESYTGVTDSDARVIASMASSAWSPMILPVLFILAPVIASIITGISLNLVFPRSSPGVYGWANLVIWYPLEAWYVVKKWQEAAKGSWISLRYWIGKKFWTNEFLVDDWTLLGRIDPTTNTLATKDYYILKKPEHQEAGDYIVEYRLRNKYFPRLLVAQKDLPERMLSFVGNVSLVQHGGLLFENEHIAAASFVRCDFTKTDAPTHIEFIPIGVFNDCAQIAQDIHDKRKFELPKTEALAQVAVAHDSHHASLFYRKLQDSEAIVQNWEKQSVDIDKRIDDRAGATIREARKSGQIPIGPGSGGRAFRMGGGKRQWLAAIVVIGIIALIIWGLS